MIDDARQRVDFHPAVHDHADAIAGAEYRVEIMRDHHDGELELAMQIQREFIKGGGADGIKAGGRLVEEQQLGIYSVEILLNGAAFSRS
jgi:hypothetical protein